MLALFDQRLSRLKRPFNHGIDADALHAKTDIARGDARDVQQVIDHVVELHNLAFNEQASLLLNGVIDFLPPQQLHGICDRGKGVAQFMAEHGQKLIFSAVQIDQRLRLLG